LGPPLDCLRSKYPCGQARATLPSRRRSTPVHADRLPVGLGETDLKSVRYAPSLGFPRDPDLQISGHPQKMEETSDPPRRGLGTGGGCGGHSHLAPRPPGGRSRSNNPSRVTSTADNVAAHRPRRSRFARETATQPRHWHSVGDHPLEIRAENHRATTVSQPRFKDAHRSILLLSVAARRAGCTLSWCLPSARR
jgi:hypothetical protein